MATNDKELLLWQQAQQNCEHDNILNARIELHLHPFTDISSNTNLVYELSAIDTAIEHIGLQIKENCENCRRISAASNSFARLVQHDDPVGPNVDEFMQMAIDSAIFYGGLSLYS